MSTLNKSSKFIANHIKDIKNELWCKSYETDEYAIEQNTMWHVNAM